jgi:hypothetical protein
MFSEVRRYSLSDVAIAVSNRGQPAAVRAIRS